MIKKNVMKLPRELTVKHYNAITYLSDAKNIDKQRFLILFYGKKHEKTIKSGYHKDIEFAFEKTVVFCESKLKNIPKNPPKKITFEDGTRLDLMDISRPSIGWMADSSAITKRNPITLLEMCYVPHGSYYGETDQNENLINPPNHFKSQFENEYLLSDFISLTAFFLKQRIKYQRHLVAIQQGEEWARRILHRWKFRKVG